MAWERLGWGRADWLGHGAAEPGRSGAGWGGAGADEQGWPGMDRRGRTGPGPTRGDHSRGGLTRDNPACKRGATPVGQGRTHGTLDGFSQYDASSAERI